MNEKETLMAEPVADPPLFDPEVHTDPDTVVRLVMCCACGHVHQQVDPVRHCLPMIAGWQRIHGGAGHRPVSAKEALAEREARREAAMRSVGVHADYTPKEREHPPTADVWDWATLAVGATL